jgi:RND family efflux transporter MFP subunit
LGLAAGGAFDVNQVPEVKSAQASVDNAKSQAALSETNAKRYAEVLKSGDVSQSSFDQAAQQARAAGDQARMAEQQYAMAVNATRQSFQMVVGARASLVSSHVQVAFAERDLESTSIRAPFSGYMSSLPVGVGQFVSPPAKVATVVQIDPLVLLLQVPESDQALLRLQLKVLARVAAYPNRDFTGTITAINPAIDNATRMIMISAKLQNPTGLLRPGMFASARIELPESTRVVFVPASAINSESGSNTYSVFVVSGKTVAQKLVRLGERDDRGVGILSGLEPGAQVATSNLAQLFDGAPVSIKNRN